MEMQQTNTDAQNKRRGRPARTTEANDGHKVAATRKIPTKKVPAGAKSIKVSREHGELAHLANTLAQNLPFNICAVITHQTERNGALTSIEVRRS